MRKWSIQKECSEIEKLTEYNRWLKKGTAEGKKKGTKGTTEIVKGAKAWEYDCANM
ncbi:conserved hypothetical protein [Ricinus communis]|uniref:Uncharacterized protein n=1 Tax=Ricinus communis TaxID=3988 RepID=B9S6R9_RICCO|nr:conserved hypothetical protein [Ricinus communis]